MLENSLKLRDLNSSAMVIVTPSNCKRDVSVGEPLLQV